MVNHRRSELLERVFIEYRYAAVLADPARLAGWEDRELTMSQLRVLFILNGDPGMTAGNLAERIGRGTHDDLLLILDTPAGNGPKLLVEVSQSSYGTFDLETLSEWTVAIPPSSVHLWPEK